MSFTESFAGYFVDFGETVTIDGSDVTAIVDMPVREALESLVRDVAITAPSTDVSAASRGSVCVIRGVTYTARTVEPDGTGITYITVTTP